MTVQKIVVSANFTIEPIITTLSQVLGKIGLIHELVFAPYNQIFQQLLNTGSLFYENRSGINIIFLRLEDLIENRKVGFEIGQKELSRINANTLELAIWLKNAESFKVPLFVFICPLSKNTQAEVKLGSEFKKIKETLIESISNNPNIYLFETEHLTNRYKIKTQDDPKSNLLGHIPYTTEFFAGLATESARQIDLLLRKPTKVLVLDCDNTIWDGVVGEDGLNGIDFCENRLFLQKFAVEQSQKGMLICLCSKNNESEVWEVFDSRSEMQLKKQHVVSSRINWQPKSVNLKSLARELQLGLDSFVFIDDDAAVCSEVQLNCPEVFTILLPPETENFADFFEHLWAFDKLRITKEDKERTESYQRQTVRNKLLAEAGDIIEFLKSLQLVCEITEIKNEHIPRVSQLSLRTNQFNSTTIRRSESDIRQIISDQKKNIWTVNVTDRFGDYGLVGVIIFEIQPETINVESFMLSCRVLGRGVEHKILQELGKKALTENCRSIKIKFQASEKNLPFQNFLSEIGDCFEPQADNNPDYKIASQIAAEFIPKKNKIQKVTDRIANKAPNKENQENLIDYQNHYQKYIELAHSLAKNLLIICVNNPSLSRENLKNEYCPARNQIEKSLTEIWEKLLKLNNIGITDDFFQIGGDSLIGVSLFVEIEEKFSKNLPLSALITSPTIEKLAQELEIKSTNCWKYLVPIQSAGTKNPLFCMHAAGGNVLFYRDLANELGTDQPLYGLQARGITDKNETSYDSVEEMAKEYLKEIRQFQPTGPYQLCGSSFGGLVAFEIASQLQKIGETVSILALFDTYSPNYLNSNTIRSKPLSPLKSVTAKLKNLRNQLAEIGTTREQFLFFVNKLSKVKKNLKRKAIWKKNQFDLQYKKTTGKELPQDMQRNHKAIEKALKTYNPPKYNGKMILFRASDQPQNVTFDRFLGWKSYIDQEIITEDVKGTHGALTVYPFAKELAIKFTPYLSRNGTKKIAKSVVAACKQSR